MNWIEIMSVGAILCFAGLILWNRVYRTAKGEKGSCKSCGDTCSCVIKDAVAKKVMSDE